MAPQPLPRADRVPDQGQARVAPQASLLAPQQQKIQPTRAGTASSSHEQLRPQKAHASVRGAEAAAAAGKLAALLAQIGKAQHRVEQVVVRRQLQGVDAGLRERRPQRQVALLDAAPRSACGSAIVRVDDQLLAGLGVLERHQAEVGQIHLERVEQADRDDLVAPRQTRRGPLPSPAR